MRDIKQLTIGFLSSRPLEDKKFLSGTIYSMAEKLKSTGATVKWIPVRDSVFWLDAYQRLCNKVSKVMPGLGRFLPKHTLWKCRIIGKNYDRSLIESCDVIFNPIQSEAMFGLETQKPIVYFSDATFHAMVDYYWFNIPEKEKQERELIEKTAIQKATALVYPCQWAADSAIRDYGQSKSKIKIARFGPNFDIDSIKPHEFSFDGHLDILFVGVDWDRKGGRIAVDACRWLNENGIDTTLHIVGGQGMDSKIATLPFVDYKGFLNKNNPEDYAIMQSLYNNADCFLLPTRAECTGVSFSEASAYGLPCFAHLTGGVSDYVFEGENGRLLPLGSTGEDFGRLIKDCIASGEMKKMSQGAVKVAKDILSWDIWLKTMTEVLTSV